MAGRVGKQRGLVDNEGVVKDELERTWGCGGG